MEKETRIYNLLVSNNHPEKAFISDYGKDILDKLRKEAFAIDMGRCAGCGHEPPEYRKQECLFYHIIELNKTKPLLTKGVTLCKMCHLTQHIESAVKNKWVIFVNSIHSQNQLIKLIRANQTHGAFIQRKIVELKKSPEKFLKEFLSGQTKFTPTLKVVFTNNFKIDDLY